MATITAQKITQAGLEPVYAAAASAGDKVLNTGIEYFHVKNASGSSVTSTVTPVITTVVDPLLGCLLYTSPSPRDRTRSRMPSSA